MFNSAEIRALGAAELGRRIRSGALTSLSVTRAFLDALDDRGRALHAVVCVAADAEDMARRADAEADAGRWLGPLHGVPFTVKDWIETRGLPQEEGFGFRKAFVPTSDATAVARLRAAGGVLIAKSRAGLSDAGPIHPISAARSPGNSSSGEAVLLAADCTPLGLGSDSGGSLRWPAHCCGVAALKPGTGRVPVTGHFPPIGGLADPRTVIGPMARRIEDLELALGIIAGPDGRDPDAHLAPLRESASVDLTNCRIARFDSIGDTTADATSCEILNRCASALQAAGAGVVQAAPPRLDEAMAITRAYWSRPESLDPDHWRPSHDSTLSADQVERSLFSWDRLRRDMLAFMADRDLLLAPVAISSAPAAGPARAEDYLFTLPFSLTGWPVVVVPAGRDPTGVGMGVQIIARPFEEHRALAAARCIEAMIQEETAP